MRITINTDASFHPKERFGGFAFWIASDIGRIKRSGPFKEKPNDPTDAEIRCIANALSVLLISAFKDIREIIVNTDCGNAIEGIRGSGEYAHKSKHYKSAKTARRIIADLRRRHPGFSDIDFRYVPAHRDTASPRTYVNNWCDERAKEAMRVARNYRKPLKQKAK